MKGDIFEIGLKNYNLVKIWRMKNIFIGIITRIFITALSILVITSVPMLAGIASMSVLKIKFVDYSFIEYSLCWAIGLATWVVLFLIVTNVVLLLGWIFTGKNIFDSKL